MLKTYQRLWQLLNPKERRQAILLLGLILLMGIAQMGGVASIMPFMSVVADPDVINTNPYLGAVYEYLRFEDQRSFLIVLAFAVLSALVLSIAIKAVTTYAIVRFSQMRIYGLSRKVMAGYLSQPYEWFLDRHSADLGKTILSESEQVIRDALSPAINIIAEGAVVMALIVLLILVDPMLAMVVAVGIGGAYAAIYVFLRGYLNRIGTQRVQANHRRFEAVQEAFGSIKDVKVTGLEGRLLSRFDSPARAFAETQAKQAVANQMPRFALEAIAFGGLLAVMIYLLALPGGLQQALPILALYAFAAYRLMPAMQNFYGQLVQMRFATYALENLHRELSQAPGGHLPKDRAKPMGLQQEIRLERIQYTYPKATRPAITDLNLVIPARTTVGLVGQTGSGKTTTVDLILGLLQPQSGRLIVDGQTIDQGNLRAWQSSIGYVPQSIYLSDDTVAANIAFGEHPDAIDEQAVEQAARMACLHEFVVNELPQGYQTTVGERGVRLSGGQRQRIGIARALYHKPDLLVLDEATSALDNLTEQAVMDAVNHLHQQITIIMIAHRLTTVRDCGRILLLDHGELVGQGTYQELLQNNSGFRKFATCV